MAVVAFNAQSPDLFIRHARSAIRLEQQFQCAIAGNVPAGNAGYTAISSQLCQRRQMFSPSCAVADGIDVGNCFDFNTGRRWRTLLTALDAVVGRDRCAPSHAAGINTAYATADTPHEIRAVSGPITNAPVGFLDLWIKRLHPAVPPGEPDWHHIVTSKMR